MLGVALDDKRAAWREVVVEWNKLRETPITGRVKAVQTAVSVAMDDPLLEPLMLAIQRWASIMPPTSEEILKSWRPLSGGKDGPT